MHPLCENATELSSEHGRRQLRIFTVNVFRRFDGLSVWAPPGKEAGDSNMWQYIEMSHSSSFTELHQVSKVLSHILKWGTSHVSLQEIQYTDKQYEEWYINRKLLLYI